MKIVAPAWCSSWAETIKWKKPKPVSYYHYDIPTIPPEQKAETTIIMSSAARSLLLYSCQCGIGRMPLYYIDIVIKEEKILFLVSCSWLYYILLERVIMLHNIPISYNINEQLEYCLDCINKIPNSDSNYLFSTLNWSTFQ